MSTPPKRKNDGEAMFSAGEQGQQTPPKKKHPNHEEGDGIISEVVDVAVNNVNFGCLLRPIIWVVTLPIRLVLKVIEAIFD